MKPHVENGFILFSVSNRKELQVIVSKKDVLTLYNVTGHVLKRITVMPGTNIISTSTMPNGTYMLKSKENNMVKRFYVFN